jgi:hypothetical protein
MTSDEHNAWLYKCADHAMRKNLELLTVVTLAARNDESGHLFPHTNTSR